MPSVAPKRGRPPRSAKAPMPEPERRKPALELVRQLLGRGRACNQPHPPRGDCQTRFRECERRAVLCSASAAAASAEPRSSHPARRFCKTRPLDDKARRYSLCHFFLLGRFAIRECLDSERGQPASYRGSRRQHSHHSEEHPRRRSRERFQ
jgi:hypothetical protein